MKQPRKQSFSLTLDGQEMIVTFVYYTHYGHFEFRSPHKPSRRIPISPSY